MRNGTAPVIRCGLAGEDIPIGARILAAVDCLDALATDRQYRRALPLDEAMKIVRVESGKAFDPKVVELLARALHRDGEEGAGRWTRMADKLSTDLIVTNGDAPAAGFEASAHAPDRQPKDTQVDFLTSIAAARQEVQALFEISQDLGNSLSLDETLSVLAVRLRKIIPHHSLAIWVRRENILCPITSAATISACFPRSKFPSARACRDGSPRIASRFSTAILRSSRAI